MTGFTLVSAVARCLISRPTLNEKPRRSKDVNSVGVEV